MTTALTIFTSFTLINVLIAIIARSKFRGAKRMEEQINWYKNELKRIEESNDGENSIAYRKKINNLYQAAREFLLEYNDDAVGKVETTEQFIIEAMMHSYNENNLLKSQSKHWNKVQDLKKEVEVLRRQSDDKDLEIIKLKQIAQGWVEGEQGRYYYAGPNKKLIDLTRGMFFDFGNENNITGSCVPGIGHLKKKAAIEYYVVDRQSGVFPPEGTDYPDGTLMVNAPLVVFSGDIAASGNVHAWVRNTDKLPTSKKH